MSQLSESPSNSTSVLPVKSYLSTIFAKPTWSGGAITTVALGSSSFLLAPPWVVLTILATPFAVYLLLLALLVIVGVFTSSDKKHAQCWRFFDRMVPWRHSPH